MAFSDLSMRKSSRRLPFRSTACALTPDPHLPQVLAANLRDHPLKVFHENALAKRPVDLHYTCLPVAYRKAPEAGVRDGPQEFAQVEVAFTVPLPGHCEHRIGPASVNPFMVFVKCTPRKGISGFGTG